MQCCCVFKVHRQQDTQMSKKKKRDHLGETVCSIGQCVCTCERKDDAPKYLRTLKAWKYTTKTVDNWWSWKWSVSISALLAWISYFGWGSLVHELLFYKIGDQWSSLPSSAPIKQSTNNKTSLRLFAINLF